MGFAVYGNHGVTHHEPQRSFGGVTLYTTIGADATRLIDMDGSVVHQWTPPAPAKPFYGFLRSNGNLLVRCYDNTEPFTGGGYGGTLLELDWDGNEVWRYQNPVIHHDHIVLKNGNIMVIGWEELTPEQESRVKGGRDDVPHRGGGGHAMLGDFLLEITPDRQVVWEWHGHQKLDPEQEVIEGNGPRAEWTHCNGVTELLNGDICISFRQTSQIVFISKATGDVYWRFGPGELSHQHNPTQLDNGNLLIFDNGETRAQGGVFSRVVELNPKTGEIVWEYRGDPSLSFFSTGISGAQRLPNGNTAICDGRTGRLFEVTAQGDIVWEYMNPEIRQWRGETMNRAIFRALRYAVDGPEVRGRV